MPRDDFATAVDGFLSGFGQAQRLELQREQNERAQAQEERAGESHELSMELNREKLRQSREQARRQEIRRSGKALVHALENDQPVSPEIVKNFSDAAGLNPTDLTDPKFRQDLDVLEQAASDPGAVERDRLIDAANNVFRRQLLKGKDETFEADGKTWTIKDKRIQGIAPGSTESGGADANRVTLDLEVTAEGPDGEVRRFDAPMTENRSAQDDLVLETPVADLAKRVKGSQAVYDAINNNPQARSKIEQALVRAGGELPQPEFGIETITVGDREVTIQTKNGRPSRVIAEGSGDRDFKIEEVHRNGRNVKAMFTADGEFVRELGRSPVDEGDDGDGFTMDDFGSGDSDEIGEVIETKLADSFSANGVPIISAEDRKEQQTVAHRLGSRLYVESRQNPETAPLTHAEAADQAMQAVIDARRQAMEEVPEVPEGGWGAPEPPEGAPKSEKERMDQVTALTRELLGLEGTAPQGRGPGVRGTRSRGASGRGTGARNPASTERRTASDGPPLRNPSASGDRRAAGGSQQDSDQQGGGQQGGGRLSQSQKDALKQAEAALEGEVEGGARDPDTVEQMLIEQFEVPPERAKQLTDKYRQ